MSENYGITITAVDKATATIRKISGQLAATTRPISDLNKAFGALGKSAGLNHVATGLRHVGTGARSAADGLRSMVPPLAAVTGIGSIAGIAALVTGFAKMAVQNRNSAYILGVSTTALYRWQAAARLAGSTAGDMQSSLEGIGMAFNAAQYTDPAKMGLLRQMHIDSVPRTQDGSVDVQSAMLDVADAFSKTSNAQWKIQAADALGIARSMIPMLSRGRAAMEKYFDQAKALAPTPEQQNKADQFYAAMLKMDFATTNLRNSLGAALAPALTVVINGMTRLVDKYGDAVASGIADYAKRLADFLTNTNWSKVADDVSKFVDAIGGVKGIAIALAAITFAGPIAGVLRLTGLLLAMSATAIRAGASLAFGALTPVAAEGAAAGGAAVAAESGGILLGSGGLIARLAGLVASRAFVGGGLLFHSQNLGTGESDDLAQRRQLGGREKFLADRLTQAGYSHAQAAGIIGSLLQEDSTLDPDKVNDQSGARGIAQWLSKDRLAGFKAFTGHDLAGSSFEEQVSYLLHELQTSESAANRRILAAKTPAEAARAHALGYERAGASEVNLGRREAMSNDIYASLYGAPKPMSTKSDKLNAADFQIIDTQADKLNDADFQIVDTQAGKQSAPMQLHMHITGLPAGAQARVKTSTPGAAVTATVGQTSLGHDTL